MSSLGVLLSKSGVAIAEEIDSVRPVLILSKMLLFEIGEFTGVGGVTFNGMNSLFKFWTEVDLLMASFFGSF